MKEIDIKGIIDENFRHRMSGVKYVEYSTMYDALHSSEYRKVSQRNFGAICERFDVATVDFYYLSSLKPIQMKVSFNISFDFEYAERKTYDWDNSDNGLPKEYPCGEKFSVKPIFGIDEIGIELDELSMVNKEVYKLLWDNIPSGGGNEGRIFRYYCISGMHCEGHSFHHSHVKLDKRIVDFFNYLFGMVDQACDYQEHPELKPKIVEVENTSFREDDYDAPYEYIG